MVSRNGMRVHLPVEYPPFDAVLESIQGNVVLHELLHLLLVRHHERSAESATTFCDGKTDNTTPRAELQSVIEGPVSFPGYRMSTTEAPIDATKSKTATYILECRRSSRW